MKGPPRRILVVDDEPDVQDLVRMILESGGYLVDCADNGEEALARIQHNPPDLVILDLMMPVMTGWQVLERLGGKSPPVVVILSAAADKDQASQAGAKGCLSKPFDSKVLLDTCKQLLAR